jgi:protein-disulfide isomerase
MAQRLTFWVAAAFWLAVNSALGPALAQATSPSLGMVEMSLGKADAPVTIIEYASLTCPHCANFHEKTLPDLKRDYIDTGKVRLVFREVYFNKPALWAAMIARCAPADRYFGIADALFATQQSWAAEQDPQAMLGKLYGIGRQAGLTDAEMNACMQDRTMAEALVAEYQKNAEADAIDATPTFLINGEKVSNMPWEEFAAKLDAALGA